MQKKRGKSETLSHYPALEGAEHPDADARGFSISVRLLGFSVLIQAQKCYKWLF